MLGSTYSASKTEGDHISGGTRVLEQMASIMSDLHMAVMPLFCPGRGALKEKGARPIEKIALIVLGL